jgi:hypothetical protein
MIVDYQIEPPPLQQPWFCDNRGTGIPAATTHFNKRRPMGGSATSSENPKGSGNSREICRGICKNRSVFGGE